VAVKDGKGDDRVEIAPYDPDWPARFDREKVLIQGALGDMAVEVHHIGSTAVPGLAAKPVIDIMVAVESLEDQGILEDGLCPLGYVNVPHEDDRNRLFFRKGTPREYHVHVVRLNSWTYWKHLVFRDALASGTELRMEYERLKFDLAARFGDDRETYTNAKSGFIERVVMERVRAK